MGSVGGSQAKVFMETVNSRRVKPSNLLMCVWILLGKSGRARALVMLGEVK